MKTISIRELHERTGLWVRETARYGEIRITDHGRLAGILVPAGSTPAVGWSARRPQPGFKRLQRAGRLKPLGDSTRYISEDRDRD